MSKINIYPRFYFTYIHENVAVLLLIKQKYEQPSMTDIEGVGVSIKPVWATLTLYSNYKKHLSQSVYNKLRMLTDVRKTNQVVQRQGQARFY